MSLPMPRSHPTMGAWIEIFIHDLDSTEEGSRTPRWVRGLKLVVPLASALGVPSHPTMGAWIEIAKCRQNHMKK